MKLAAEKERVETGPPASIAGGGLIPERGWSEGVPPAGIAGAALIPEGGSPKSLSSRSSNVCDQAVADGHTPPVLAPPPPPVVAPDPPPVFPTPRRPREPEPIPEGVVPEGVISEGVLPEGVVPEGVVPEGGRWNGVGGPTPAEKASALTKRSAVSRECAAEAPERKSKSECRVQGALCA